MAGGAAVPEVGAVASWFLAFTFIVSFLILTGVLWTYRNTFGWLFTKIGNVSVGHYPIVGTIRPFKILLTLNNDFVSALGAAAAKQEQLAGKFWHWGGVIQGWIVRETKDFALSVWHWRKWLERAYLPLYLGTLIARALRAAHIGTITKVVSKTATVTLPTVVEKRIGLTRRQVAAMIAAAVAATGATVGTLPRLWPRIRDLEREAAQDSKRLRKLSWATAFTGAAALVLAALARLGLNWIRCRNVKSAGRAVCRLDTGLLSELLTDGLLVFGAVSVVEFAKELQAIEGEVIDVCGRLVREWPS